MKLVSAIKMTKEEKDAVEKVVKMLDCVSEAEENLLDEHFWDNDSPNVQDVKSSLRLLLSLNRD
jgi:hypothetical protein